MYGVGMNFSFCIKLVVDITIGANRGCAAIRGTYRATTGTARATARRHRVCPKQNWQPRSKA